MIWCPYTDRDLELEETNPEHIIPLSLGGSDQLVIPVDAEKNSELGTEIDGKLTEDFIVRFLRREADTQGHSGKKPKVIFKHSTFEERPAQAQFLGGDNLPRIWDARSASYIDSEKIPGKEVTINFGFDPSLILRFAAKVALSGGYFAFGDYWRQHVDHAQARLIMNARTVDQRRTIESQVEALFHDIYTELPDEQRVDLETLKLCCASVKGSIVMIVPVGRQSVWVVVGVLGHYLGMLNLPADTSQFPKDPSYDLGHCLEISEGKLIRYSWRELLKSKLLKKLLESLHQNQSQKGKDDPC